MDDFLRRTSSDHRQISLRKCRPPISERQQMIVKDCDSQEGKRDEKKNGQLEGATYLIVDFSKNQTIVRHSYHSRHVKKKNKMMMII